MLVTESARCPRPADLPEDMTWSEKLYNGEEVFDPYVYLGDMRTEDYEKMCLLMGESVDDEEYGESEGYEP